MPSLSNAQRFEVVPSRAAAEFHRLPSPVRDILKLCDGTRTLDAICARSALPVERTEKVLTRLAALGVVAIRRAEEAQRRQLNARSVSWIQGAVPADVVVAAIAVAPHPPAPVLPDPPVLPPVTATPGFTDEEEQFFSSSIEHLIET